MSSWGTKNYTRSKRTRASKAGFVEQAVTRVVVAKHTDTTAPNRPGKRTRAVEQEQDGRMPRLLTKLEVEHAPNRRAKNAD